MITKKKKLQTATIILISMIGIILLCSCSVKGSDPINYIKDDFFDLEGCLKGMGFSNIEYSTETGVWGSTDGGKTWIHSYKKYVKANDTDGKSLEIKTVSLEGDGELRGTCYYPHIKYCSYYTDMSYIGHPIYDSLGKIGNKVEDISILKTTYDGVYFEYYSAISLKEVLQGMKNGDLNWDNIVNKRLNEINDSKTE